MCHQVDRMRHSILRQDSLRVICLGLIHTPVSHHCQINPTPNNQTFNFETLVQILPSLGDNVRYHLAKLWITVKSLASLLLSLPHSDLGSKSLHRLYASIDHDGEVTNGKM